MTDNFKLTFINDDEWILLNEFELLKVAEIYFDTYLKQKVVRNLDKNIEIIIAKEGFKHTKRCNTWSYINFVVFKKLDEILEKAIFTKLGEKKPTDSLETRGYLNFISVAIINGQEFQIKISVREHIQNVKKEKYLWFYYDHYEIK